MVCYMYARVQRELTSSDARTRNDEIADHVVTADDEGTGTQKSSHSRPFDDYDDLTEKRAKRLSDHEQVEMLEELEVDSGRGRSYDSEPATERDSHRSSVNADVDLSTLF